MTQLVAERQWQRVLEESAGLRAKAIVRLPGPKGQELRGAIESLTEKAKKSIEMMASLRKELQDAVNVGDWPNVAEIAKQYLEIHSDPEILAILQRANHEIDERDWANTTQKASALSEQYKWSECAECYRDYLRAHPDGLHRPGAEDGLRSVESKARRLQELSESLRQALNAANFEEANLCIRNALQEGLLSASLASEWLDQVKAAEQDFAKFERLIRQIKLNIQTEYSLTILRQAASRFPGIQEWQKLCSQLSEVEQQKRKFHDAVLAADFVQATHILQSLRSAGFGTVPSSVLRKMERKLDGAERAYQAFSMTLMNKSLSEENRRSVLHRALNMFPNCTVWRQMLYEGAEDSSKAAKDHGVSKKPLPPPVPSVHSPSAETQKRGPIFLWLAASLLLIALSIPGVFFSLVFDLVKWGAFLYEAAMEMLEKLFNR